MTVQCGNCRRFTPFLDSPNGLCALTTQVQPAFTGNWWCPSFKDKETGKGPPERWTVRKQKAGRRKRGNTPKSKRPAKQAS